MAIYDSNKRYTCNKCGYDKFMETEEFLIEEISDKSKLSAPSFLKRTSSTKRIICISCNHPVHEDVK